MLSNDTAPTVRQLRNFLGQVWLRDPQLAATLDLAFAAWQQDPDTDPTGDGGGLAPQRRLQKPWQLLQHALCTKFAPPHFELDARPEDGGHARLQIRGRHFILTAQLRELYPQPSSADYTTVFYVTNAAGLPTRGAHGIAQAALYLRGFQRLSLGAQPGHLRLTFTCRQELTP